MGYNVHAYAVDLGRLSAAVGSKDRALFASLSEKSAHALAEVEQIDASPPAAVDALAALLDGRMEDGEVNFKYGYALELVCRELGTSLSNRCWSSMNGEWFDAVEDAFHELDGTTKICSEVFWSGPPVELPFIDDFPAIGTVRSEQAGLLATELEVALERAKRSPEAAALRELLEWLRLAQRSACGIVTFYY